MRYLISFIILTIVLSSCRSSKPFYSHHTHDWDQAQLPSSDLTQTVYLIGDAGKPDTLPLENALAIAKQMISKENPEKTSVVFLGDNLYPEGLHKNKHEERPEDEAHLDAQISVVKDAGCRAFFIPGNHDWKQGDGKGKDYVKRQERYIEKHLGKNAFIPENGCPGPEVIKVGEDIAMVVVDTQWWLHKGKRPYGIDGDCDAQNEQDFIFQFGDALRGNRYRHLLVLGHHPMYTNGEHGGKFTFNDHFFPLTNVKPNLFIPLPVLGSIYPLYRNLLGDIQDVAHPRYRSMVEGMTTALSNYPGTIYACGHEHNLQYKLKDSVHYVVSGAGCKTDYVRRNHSIDFGYEGEGFSILRYYENGEVWMDMIDGNASSPASGEVIYRVQIEKSKPKPPAISEAPSNFKEGLVKTAAEHKFEANNFKQKFFGSLYRSTWTADIEVPMLDVQNIHGGLTPLKRGGGFQTKSLRLEGGDGNEYVFRTIAKDPTALVSRNMRKTVAQDIVHDGLAASHPYAAFVVPPIATAAGVYHTNPQLVVIPDDPQLDEFRGDFANKLCLFEERPSGDQRHNPDMGNSKDVIGSSDVIEKLQEDHDNSVDEYAMLRARLLDMLLADWDRHDDQWRWASFKTDHGEIYKPIPRDRDQVFFRQDGLIPNISNRQWAIRKFQSFKEDIRDIAGQNFNARFVDRAYLTPLELSDWIAMADSLQMALPDEVLSDAIKLLPPEVYNIEGEYLTRTLLARKQNLKRFAERYYLVLAKEVDVVGSEKDEYFEVIRENDEEVTVRMFPRNKKGKPKRDHLLYERTFKRSETKEIRLYGIEGEDEYQISGDVKKSILVRIIGGQEKDKYEDHSHVRGMRSMTRIYDSAEKKKKKRNKLELGNEAKIQLASGEDVIDYDRTGFKYNSLLPIIYPGFNQDDGVYIGGGFISTKYGFDKLPYKMKATVRGNYAAETGAFNFYVDYHLPEVFGNWDFGFELDAKGPDFNYNFFGLGNDVEQLVSDINTYRLRLNIFDFSPEFRLSNDKGNQILHFGPTFQSASLEEDPFDLAREGILIPFDIETEADFGGLRLVYEFANKDNNFNPSRGIDVELGASYLQRIDAGDDELFNLYGELIMYFPIGFLPGRSTLALRTGGQMVEGDYAFYQAAYLSGTDNFRGIRRNRFGGDASFYNSAELRLHLFDIYNYILPFEIGVTTFYDYGRVFYDNEESNTWHNAYGGGLYISPLNTLVINANYAISDVDELFTLGFGFSF